MTAASMDREVDERGFGMLSNSQIFTAIDGGLVVIHPLVRENVRKASIDLTLGEWYYPTQQGRRAVRGVFNPFDKGDVDRYYGVEPRRAAPWSEYPESIDGPLVGVPEDHPIILVPARACILAHTHEFAGAMAELGTTMMKARSTWGRLNIEVCRCAGMGDPGYINRWTMEIQNNNDEAVPLPVGERIAQLMVIPTGRVSGGTYGREDGYRSKYQAGRTLAEVVESWTPEAMKPRAYQDERVMPSPVGVAL